MFIGNESQSSHLYNSHYFLGLGDDYAGSFELAAAKMSFSYFERDQTVDAEDQPRCRLIADDDDVLLGEGAPRTVEGIVRLIRLDPKNLQSRTLRLQVDATRPGRRLGRV